MLSKIEENRREYFQLTLQGNLTLIPKAGKKHIRKHRLIPLINTERRAEKRSTASAVTAQGNSMSSESDTIMISACTMQTVVIFYMVWPGLIINIQNYLLIVIINLSS